MKKLLFGFLLALSCHLAFTRNLPDFSTIPLAAKEDYTPTANGAALQAANFLLSTPLDSKNINRLKSTQYVIKWMSGTPDYTFSLDEQATKFAKKNDDLLALYMAAMTKYTLENKEEAKDPNKVKLNAVKSIIAYAKDLKNNVKLNSELKKATEADEKGQLSQYLKIE